MHTHTDTHIHTCMRKLQDSQFREKEKEKKQYLTDSRAGVRFRFNVRLHVDEGCTGEELGLVWKGVG